MKKPTEEPGITPAALTALAAGDVGNFLVASTPGGIEAQEAAGQDALCLAHDRLPIRGTIDRPATRAQWEAVGFVFGEQIAEPSQRGRHVFVACAFPEGWSLRASEHPMWSDVVDGKGSPRAEVFFKAAFYDFSSHTFGLRPRYDCRSVTAGGGREYGVHDRREGRLIHVVRAWPTEDAFYASRDDTHRQTAANWLKEHFPHHADPLAYWD